MPPSTLSFDDRGAGPAVVLIHGHPFDRSMWAPQLEPLSARFRVLAPDLRGYGESPVTPGTVTMADLAGDVSALLDSLEIEAAAVVGLSMGGLVAMELALARPERWWALGLIATTAAPLTEGERQDRCGMAGRLESEGMEAAVETMGPRLFGPSPPPGAVAEIERVMRRTDPAGAAAALRGRAERPDYRPGLGKLEMPVLVCTGSEDAYSTAEITAELVGSLRAPRVLLLPGIGHLPNLERPEEFNRELLDFLTASAP
jgi:3-oxoadipate enol-lactonase